VRRRGACLPRPVRAVRSVPWPVVEGFTLGIACIIFLQQVPAAVGVPADPGHNTLVTALAALGTAASAGTLSPALWALGCVALVAVTMLLLPRLHPGIPASLVAVVLVTVLVEAVGAPVARIGALPASLPAPVLP